MVWRWKKHWKGGSVSQLVCLFVCRRSSNCKTLKVENHFTFGFLYQCNTSSWPRSALPICSSLSFARSPVMRKFSKVQRHRWLAWICLIFDGRFLTHHSLSCVAAGKLETVRPPLVASNFQFNLSRRGARCRRYLFGFLFFLQFVSLELWLDYSSSCCAWRRWLRWWRCA